MPISFSDFPPLTCPNLHVEDQVLVPVVELDSLILPFHSVLPDEVQELLAVLSELKIDANTLLILTFRPNNLRILLVNQRLLILSYAKIVNFYCMNAIFYFTAILLECCCLVP